MDAVVVAGGAGTRLQPLTFSVPKPLLPFCGAPLLAGVLRRLAAADVDRLFLVVGPDTRPFEILRLDAEELGVRLSVVPEPRPLDTAGGMRAISDWLGSPSLVLNGDILTDIDYTALVAAHSEAGAAATIALTRVRDTRSYGVAVRDGSRIVRFVEKPEAGSLPGHDTVNAGTYAIEPYAMRPFPDGPLSFERDVFPGMLEAGEHLEGFVWEGVWADIGTPARYLDGHELALTGRLSWPLPPGIEEVTPGVQVGSGAEVAPGAELRPPVLVMPGARVEDGARLGPVVVLGRGAHVGAGSRLERCVLHDGVRVGAAVEAVELLAGTGASIRTGARLGRGVVLGSGQEVQPGADLADGQRVPPATGAA